MKQRDKLTLRLCAIGVGSVAAGAVLTFTLDNPLPLLLGLVVCVYAQVKSSSLHDEDAYEHDGRHEISQTYEVKQEYGDREITMRARMIINEGGDDWTPPPILLVETLTGNEIISRLTDLQNFLKDEYDNLTGKRTIEITEDLIYELGRIIRHIQRRSKRAREAPVRDINAWPVQTFTKMSQLVRRSIHLKQDIAITQAFAARVKQHWDIDIYGYLE